MFALGNQVKADLIVDLTDLSLSWKNTGLQSNCGLSNEDERFIDHIYEQVVAHREAGVSSQNFIGSNAWIRSMFYDYTKYLLSCSADASLRKSGEHLAPFNSRWCAQWRITENYKHWTNTVDKPGIVAACPPGHASNHIQTFFASLASGVGEFAEGLSQAYDNLVDPNTPGVLDGISQAYDNFHLVDPNAPSVLTEISQAYDNFKLTDSTPVDPANVKPGVIETAIEVVKEVIQEAFSSTPAVPAASASADSEPIPEGAGTGGANIFDDFIGTIRGGIQKILADDLSSLEQQGVTVDQLLAQDVAPADAVAPAVPQEDN